MTKKAKIVEWRRNEVLPCTKGIPYDRKCGNPWCEYKIPLEQLQDLYKGSSCWGFLNWECPRCGKHNRILLRMERVCRIEYSTCSATSGDIEVSTSCTATT